MRRENRSGVRILWSETNPQFGKSLDMLFLDEGLTSHHFSNDCDEIANIIAGDAPDLLILDIMTPDGTAFDLIKNVRANKLGNDPFLTIIGTSWDSQTPIIDHIYECGADEAFLKPAPARRLIERIFALAADKRTFLVTSTYVGPDRRRDGPRTDDGFRLQVPSSLKARADGRPTDSGAQLDLRRQAITQINAERLQRGATQISMLVETFLPSCIAGRSDAEAITAMNEAIGIATDLKERAPLGGSGHMVELCEAFLRIAADMRRIARSPNPNSQDQKNLKLAKSLSDALSVGFNPRLSNPSSMAKDVGLQLNQDLLARRIDRR